MQLSALKSGKVLYKLKDSSVIKPNSAPFS
jgi:hypothetical protein